MISLTNISKQYKIDFWAPSKDVLIDVNFSIKPGKITGFLGENGAGKTTLIKIMLGLSKANSGDIHYGGLGKNITEAKKLIGYMPERPYYYPECSGWSILNYFGKLCDLNDSNRKKCIEYWSKRLDIHYALSKPIKTYSKGMLQRLGLVSAVIHSPMLIILDEPTSGMDPIGRVEIKNILKQLCSEHGATVFFSTHVIPDVEEICDEIVILHKGQVSYSGNLTDFLDTHYSKEYIINFVDGNKPDFISCEINQVQKKLKDLIENDKVIMGVKRKSKTLEEVIYNL